MPDAASMTGRCMCGACSFAATPQEMHGGACHCEMCRKWSGGMFLAVGCGDTVRFADDAPIVTYDSSDWGQRVFCGTCGSALVWQFKDKSMQVVSVQAFDTPEAFPIVSEIYIDKKPSSYALAGDLKQMTEAEVTAMFAPSGGA